MEPYLKTGEGGDGADIGENIWSTNPPSAVVQDSYWGETLYCVIPYERVAFTADTGTPDDSLRGDDIQFTQNNDEVFLKVDLDPDNTVNLYFPIYEFPSDPGVIADAKQIWKSDIYLPWYHEYSLND